MAQGGDPAGKDDADYPGQRVGLGGAPSGPTDGSGDWRTGSGGAGGTGYAVLIPGGLPDSGIVGCGAASGATATSVPTDGLVSFLVADSDYIEVRPRKVLT